MYPDIKSIYSRENSYTILQLLEELIKDVNAIQYSNIQSAYIKDGSLHLVLADGADLDAGRLLNGDLNVSGNLAVTEKITGGNLAVTGKITGGNLAVTEKITGGEIVENMTGYSYTRQDGNITYAGCVKNGNKISFALFGSVTTGETLPSSSVYQLGVFRFPSSVGAKLIPNANGQIYLGTQGLIQGLFTAPVNGIFAVSKDSDEQFHVVLITTGLAVSSTYSFRLELTFLLSDNLAV